MPIPIAILEEIMQEQGVDGDHAILNSCVIDKSNTHQPGLLNLDLLSFFLGFLPLIEILQVQYPNNIVAQDHRFIKKITKLMKDFKAFASAATILQGIEVAPMIRK